METSQIKNFAQSLRNQLRDGVKQRLLYWGFNEKGEINEQPEPVEGGYMFRGEVFSDETVPDRWKQLKRMVDLHSIDYVIEEGAYTWFNRLMAIRILEKNDYIQPQLQYEEGTQLPHLLQNARRGIFPDMKDNELQQVKKQLRENRDNEAFARLLTHFCDTQPLISKVFGKISYSNDYTELLLPQNLLDQEGILDFIVTTDAITDEDFEQVELIGWLYQYYISEKKDEVFKSFKKRKKAGPEELPAATQIFTPEWIVRYMVENTVGRLWMDLHPDSPVRERFEYFVEPAEENPKAEPIIEDVTGLTLLDPAAGSGHILVVGFEYLMKMYREEGYTARQAVEGILENNLYGLEIDERAAQLARFAVLLKAAKYDQSVLDEDKLPHIHSFPEQTNISTAEIREFLGSEGEPYVNEFKDALNILQEGKNFGSTIQLEISREAVEFAKKRIEALQPEAVENLAVKQLLQKIEPFIYVIELLNKRYKAVAANPPYMGSRNMNGELKKFLRGNYPNSKKDLFAAFMIIGLEMLQPKGHLGMINQQSWMFLSSFKNLRNTIIEKYFIESLLHLGPNAFDEISGEVVQSVAFTLNNSQSNGKSGKYFHLTEEKSSGAKQEKFVFRNCTIFEKDQHDFEKVPGQPIAYWAKQKFIKIFDSANELSEIAKPCQGLATANNDRFLKLWFEVDVSKIGFGYSNNKEAKKSNNKWFPYNKGGGFRKWYGNREYVVNWENDGYEIKNFTNENGKLRSRPQNKDYYFREGITWTEITSGDFGARYSPEGSIFDVKGSSIFPEVNQIKFFTAFLNSSLILDFLTVLNPTISFQVGNISDLPFLHPTKEEAEQLENLAEKAIEISKWDWNRSELSWDFAHPEMLNINTQKVEDSLQGLKELSINKFQELHSLEESINEEFLGIYDLEGVVDSEVDLDKITILEDVLNDKKLKKIQNSGGDNLQGELEDAYKESETIKSLLSFGIGCLMGRYRLDEEGLFIASPSSKNQNDLKYEVQYPLLDEQSTSTESVEIDDDGLIPLIGSDGPFSDDVVYRMKDFIRIIWGEQSLTENLNYIQKKLGDGLEKFLTDKFWSYHTKLYSKRPIYWLFSSKNGAFKVLAYMHRMDKYTVQKVRQNYLHPYMDYLRNEINKLEGRDSLNSDESKQLDTYRSNLNECLEYDEVIKEVADKQIDFDLDDGVKHNYELFGDALAKI